MIQRYPKITKAVVIKLLKTVDVGLDTGLGIAKPGYMCVEAAVTFALGLPHSDTPPCVHPTLAEFKIILNDFEYWPADSKKARARVLRRLAVVQLGTDKGFNRVKFKENINTYAIEKLLPLIFRADAKLFGAHAALLEESAQLCEKHPTAETAQAIYYILGEIARVENGPSRARWAVSRCINAQNSNKSEDVMAVLGHAISALPCTNREKDAVRIITKMLKLFAEDIVQILIKMKAPGAKWLYLTE